jgi:hypothetical protein
VKVTFAGVPGLERGVLYVSAGRWEERIGIDSREERVHEKT